MTIFLKKLQMYVIVMMLALLIVLTLVVVAYKVTVEFSQARVWVRHTNAVISKVNDFAINVQNAEKTRLHALLTNDEQSFAKYLVISNTYKQAADELDQLTTDNPAQQQYIKSLHKMISQLAELRDTSLASQKALMAKQSTTKDLMFDLNNEMSEVLSAMQIEEKSLLTVRYSKTNGLLEKLKLTYLVLVAAFTFLVILGYFLYRKTNLKRISFQKNLISSQALAHSNLQNLSIMSEMSNLLLACRDTTESFSVIAHFAEKIIQSDAGALYLYWESRNQLEGKAEWGEKLESQLMFEPSTCWALRRGQMHVHDHTVDTIPCSHIAPHAHVSSICIPISAQGIVQGAIYFQRAPLSSFTEAEKHLLGTFSSQIALALANMRLKDTLRDQSVRDTLTGLFNRRFMEESLQQIMSNAVRKNLQYAIVMLDIDHFKQFNDTYGHDAGDAILREIGQLLKNTVRGSDTACRYGGEEFVLIYADNSLEFVEKRCVELLKKIEALNIKYLGNSLGVVTASIGIALYPTHAITTEALIRAADAALYEAKASGRNQLKIAH